ncbi:MAG TPA: hypothetical protein VGO26_07735 [Amnibacterium sp.]|nr:hypothetical protein [Amnibacterium sp.]
MAQESIARLYRERATRRALDRASIEAEAEEGLLLAEYATRMRLKNRIVVDTMTGGGPVDLDAWIDEVRLSLGRLRVESEASARRMASERDVASSIGGVARHEHDYRQRDADNLERRRRVHLALARRLIRWENDDERVRTLLAAARDDAYREMRAAITATLARSATTPAEDAELLEERLRLLTAVDLPALAAERRPPLADGQPEAGEPPATGPPDPQTATGTDPRAAAPRDGPAPAARQGGFARLRARLRRHPR